MAQPRKIFSIHGLDPSMIQGILLSKLCAGALWACLGRSQGVSSATRPLDSLQSVDTAPNGCEHR